VLLVSYDGRVVMVVGVEVGYTHEMERWNNGTTILTQLFRGERFFSAEEKK